MDYHPSRNNLLFIPTLADNQKEPHMNTLEAIQTRRAVKHYDESFTIPNEDFETLMNSVLLSPTSYNIQNWRFVRITDKTLRAQIKEAGWGQEQIGAASELVILCADLNAWNDRPERYWANADHQTQDMLLPMICLLYTSPSPRDRG